jgi:hypothetical protein
MWERQKGCKALFHKQHDGKKADYRRFHGHAGSAFSRNSRSASGDRLSRGLEAIGWPSLRPRRSSRSYDRRASAESFGRPSAAILSRNSCKVFSESSGMADPAAEEHGIDISAVGQGWFHTQEEGQGLGEITGEGLSILHSQAQSSTFRPDAPGGRSCGRKRRAGSCLRLTLFRC